ncbi:MAG: hypothetical protein VW557_12695, partial [Rhodospirillaceae bacterium]
KGTQYLPDLPRSKALWGILLKKVTRGPLTQLKVSSWIRRRSIKISGEVASHFDRDPTPPQTYRRLSRKTRSIADHLTTTSPLRRCLHSLNPLLSNLVVKNIYLIGVAAAN